MAPTRIVDIVNGGNNVALSALRWSTLEAILCVGLSVGLPTLFRGS